MASAAVFREPDCSCRSASRARQGVSFTTRKNRRGASEDEAENDTTPPVPLKAIRPRPGGRPAASNHAKVRGRPARRILEFGGVSPGAFATRHSTPSDT